MLHKRILEQWYRHGVSRQIFKPMLLYPYYSFWRVGQLEKGLDVKHGPRFMSTTRQLVEEHEFSNVSMS